MNRVREAIDLKSAPFSYLFSQYCFKSTFLILKSLITGKKIDIEKPGLNKAEFWKYQLESSANNFYRDYKYPEQMFAGLSDISKYCEKNGIKLIFFIPPTHIDLQQKVNEFKLVSKEKKFKSDLAKIGIVYDFDYPNKITQNRTNYTDPFHHSDSISNVVIKEIITGNLHYGRKGLK
jgi:hypothetical protein